jgi:hypothetical protein
LPHIPHLRDQLDPRVSANNAFRPAFRTATRGRTPFVGREDELRLLMNRWELALDGEGPVALIIGEAGMGKSRLMPRFHELIVPAPHTRSRPRAALKTSMPSNERLD